MVPMVTVILLLWCFPAAAQSIYKCTVGGKVVYADLPCASGEVAELAVPAAPPPDKEAASLLARQKAMLAKLEKERDAQDIRDARAAARDNKAASSAARRCAKLRLQQRWLDEDIYKVMSEQREAARQKAQRHRQTMAIECPG